ncbi:MAG: fibronectin type III domain-containing protein [Patescibacteria group bacterium]|nr:fibronectin type III domain-containing protein [Patescibacteria group bacterium]
MRKRGVALLWTVVLSSVLLIISGTMVSYIIKESQFSVKIEDSVKAYSAARSGIVWGTKGLDDASNAEDRDNFAEASLDGIQFDLIGNDEVPETTVTITGTNPSFIIESECTYNGVTRKLEYEYTASSPNVLQMTPGPAEEIQISDYNTESFSMTFKFWGTHSTMFGLNSNDNEANVSPDTVTTDDPYIAMRVVADNYGTADRTDNVRLQTRDKSGSIDRSDFIKDSSNNDYNIYSLPEDVRRKPYYHKVTIKYIKDTAVSIKLYAKNAEGSYDCVGGTSLSLVGKDFGNLNSIFVYDSAGLDGYDRYPENKVIYTYREDLPANELYGNGKIIIGDPEGWDYDLGYYVNYGSVELTGVEVITGYTPPAPPPAPSAPTTTSGNTEVSLTWPAVDGATPEVTSYEVYYGSSPDTLAKIDPGPGLDTTFVINGLNNYQTYYFAITAVNSIGESQKSSTSTESPGWRTVEGVELSYDFFTGLWAYGDYASETCSNTYCYDINYASANRRELRRDNGVDFRDTNYTARDICQAKGGTLPLFDDYAKLRTAGHLTSTYTLFWTAFEATNERDSSDPKYRASIFDSSKPESYNEVAGKSSTKAFYCKRY